MRIEAVGFRGFPPFTDSTIEFPELDSDSLAEVHLLAGRNGTGKTRLLCLLAAACGNAADLNARHTFTGETNAFVAARATPNHLGVYFANSIRNIAPPKLQFLTPTRILNSDARSMIMDAKETPQRFKPDVDRFPSILEYAVANGAQAAVVSAKGTGLIDDAEIDVLKDPATTGFTESLSFDRSTKRDEETTRTIAYLIMSAGLDARRGSRTDSRSLRILRTH